MVLLAIPIWEKKILHFPALASENVALNSITQHAISLIIRRTEDFNNRFSCLTCNMKKKRDAGLYLHINSKQVHYYVNMPLKITYIIERTI